MLILECSQGCYRRTDGRKDGRTDGSVTISLRNFVGEGIISLAQVQSGRSVVFSWYSGFLYQKKLTVTI